ncbi:hypothetical protein SISSUDRAFT_956114, partial [Sistotremastrum suecicum HHB10207 ss-3]
YTWIDSDHPLHAPLEVPKALLSFDDTDHYSITNGTEWNSVFPSGGGFVHLGPNDRLFGIMMFHEFHCMNMIREAIMHNDVTGHVHHCFNFMRQAILCGADTTLEPEFEPGIGGGVGVTHVCRDWSVVYDYATHN